MYKWAYSTSKSDNVKQIIIVSICDFQVIYNFNLSKTKFLLFEFVECLQNGYRNFNYQLGYLFSILTLASFLLQSTVVHFLSPIG